MLTLERARLDCVQGDEVAQRGLGARQQVGSRRVATALREPLRVGFVGQLEVSISSLPNASTAARAARAGVMTRLSSQSSMRLSIAEATHEAILGESLLTRRRSFTRFFRSLLLTV